MLGTTHATSGAAGWLAVAPAAAKIAGLNQLGFKELAAGTLVCAGAALLPDLDHPQATIAQTLGPVTKAIARITNLLSGGHRMGTHTILFALGAGGIAAAIAAGGSTTALALVWCLTALALKGIGLTPPKIGIGGKGVAIAIEATLIVWLMTQFMPGTWWWLGLAVGVGCLIHVVGDMLTPEGCPIFLPFSRRRYSFPIISHTGNFVEKAIFLPLFTVAACVLVYTQIISPASGLPSPF